VVLNARIIVSDNVTTGRKEGCIRSCFRIYWWSFLRRIWQKERCNMTSADSLLRSRATTSNFEGLFEIVDIESRGE
jgi:hypothetical protein